MRWSELAGKEIINIETGSRLGRAGEAEIVFNPETGEIEGLEVPLRRGFGAIFSLGRYVAVPWRSIRRIGPEVIIIESPGRDRVRGRSLQ